jgi:hypothetical protein
VKPCRVPAFWISKRSSPRMVCTQAQDSMLRTRGHRWPHLQPKKS